MNKIVNVNSLVRFLQDLQKVSKDNIGRTIRIENPLALVKTIENYQVEVLHDLSKGIVNSSNLRNLIDINKRIFSVRNVHFEDETIPQMLLDIYNHNIETLQSLSETVKDQVENEIIEEALRDADTQEFYQLTLNKKLNDFVRDFEKNEKEEIEKLAESDLEAISLGIPASSIHRDFRNGEERLSDILQAIREEQLEEERNRIQDLSMFEESKSLVKYREKKQHNLTSTLDAVSESLIRNNPRENLISQGYKPKEEQK